jgi:SAM-dependent methyltransferase
MLSVARLRAGDFGIDNVEFKRLELEWIDLETASVDAILCRWALMLCVDPATAAGEMRRVLRPGGRAAVAVWDQAALNPWATIAGRALIELGHAEPPSPGEPGMFALAAPGRLQELLEAAGFVDVRVESVAVQRRNPGGVDEYVAETLDLSMMFGDVYGRLSDDERAEVVRVIGEAAAEFIDRDGALTLPGRSLVAGASA